MRRFPTRPSRRDIANRLAFMGGSTVMEQAAEKKPRAKQRAPEQEVMKLIREWASARGDLTLWRNNVGALEWRPGRWLRYGLCVGSSDFVGLTSVVVTSSMVGRRIAVLTCIEAKAPEGVVSEEQQRFIEKVRDAGGIAGIARNAGEADELVNRWKEKAG